MRAFAFVLGFAIAGIAPPAIAHAFLQSAVPAANASLATAPVEIALQFSETLEPTFSDIDITDAAGNDVKAAPVVTQGTSMRVSLKPLNPGNYRVRWRAVSIDTHRTEGQYGFEIKP